MCLAIPGRIVARDPADPQFATVEVAGVRRKVNVDLIAHEPLDADQWVLIHVGFAMTRIGEREAEEQMRLLSMLGEDEQAMQELEGYRFR